MWLEDMINTISPSEDHNMDSVDDKDFAGLPCDVSYDLELGGEEDFHYFGGGGEDISDGNEVCAGEVIDYFPEPPLAYEDGYTFLGLFDADKNSSMRLAACSMALTFRPKHGEDQLFSITQNDQGFILVILLCQRTMWSS
ncbi:hypothetical protein BDR06DRAFT_973281 [Suillus hirtellus]|nr:hypothetical protein BDR06DRAFT_973281 [Suillus hirtellus]